MSKEFSLKNFFQEIEKLLKDDHFYDALKIAKNYSEKEPRLLRNPFFLNLIGFINLNLKDWDTAILNFEKAIKLDENHKPAYFNLAIAFYDLGDMKSSYENLIKVSNIDKDNKRVKENITKILNHIDINKKNDPLSRANHELQKIKIDLDFSKKINDTYIDDLLSKSKLIISNYLTDFSFREHQLFIHNRKDLNCERHMKIFRKYKTISKNCFTCFKIIIHIEKVYDLIKLSLLFNNLELLNNFEMKCRIDFKKKNYRGYIYCDRIEELDLISENLTEILNVNFQNRFKLEKRRGCSEFSETYHKFKKINKDLNKMFQYQDSWEQKEKLIDNQIYRNGNPIIRNVKKPLKGMTLNYFLIINNWINFSKNNEALKI